MNQPGPKDRSGWHRDSGQSRPDPALWLSILPSLEASDGRTRGCEIPGLGLILSRFCRAPGLSQDNAPNSGSEGLLRGHTYHITKISRKLALQPLLGWSGRTQVEPFQKRATRNLGSGRLLAWCAPAGGGGRPAPPQRVRQSCSPLDDHRGELQVLGVSRASPGCGAITSRPRAIVFRAAFR